MAFMKPACFRLLDTLDMVGQTYFRLRHTELWASFKVCEMLIEGHRLYRKWSSIPRFVKMLDSPDDSRRVIGIQELEFLCSKNAGTRAFSQRALELGALPGILACLSNAAPTAVCAALCILSDVYSHPLCRSAFTPRVLALIFSLLRVDDLYLRLRSALLLALLSSEEKLREEVKVLVTSEIDFIPKTTDLIWKPLPERYQMAIELPDPQMNNSTYKHLKNCESQVRKSGLALLYLVSKDKEVIQKIDMAKIVPVLIKSIRANDAGLRSASLRCLKIFVRGNASILDIFEKSMVLHWKEIMPNVRDLEILHAIEDLGGYPKILDKVIQDVYFLHRMPNLLTSRNLLVRTMAFRSLYPFTLMDQHRWKVVQSGLLYLIFEGLFDGNKSICIPALICLSQLCASQEVCLVVQAEIKQQPPLPSIMVEYLILLVLYLPKDDIGVGALRLLGDAIPKVSRLPARVLPKLSNVLLTGDDFRKTGTAKLVAKIANVEKFRDRLLRSPIVNELISLANKSDGECRASVYEALALFSGKKQIACQLINLKGLTESLWRAQESENYELAAASLELLRVLSSSLGYLPGGSDRTLDARSHQ